MLKCIMPSGKVKFPRLLVDTSVLFKIVAPDLSEIGTKEILDYLEPGIFVNATSFSVVETLTTAKLNWNRKKKPIWLTDDGYLMIINRLFHKICLRKIRVKNPNLYKYFDDAVQIVKSFGIDILDASLILFFKKNPKFDLLVTADNALEDTATKLGVPSWNVLKSTSPEFNQTFHLKG